MSANAVVSRAAGILMAVSGPVFALTPAEVFERVSPSVWAVRALDEQGRPFSFASGVVVQKARIVTNCHVLARAKAIQVRRDNVGYEATLEHADAERDLCILAVPQLPAPTVEIADLSTVKVGHRAYVVGNPERLSLTLSEGLISGLRSEDPNLPPIQTTAPISQGAGGGGLFDEQARLIGITTLNFVGRQHIAQHLNFAVPAEWIREVPQRTKEQHARKPEADVSAAPPGQPRVGDEWKYSMRDQKYNQRESFFTARVTAVNGSSVDEMIHFDSGAAIGGATDAKLLRFATRTIDERLLVELSPYLTREGGETAQTFGAPADYPLGISGERFRMRVESIGQDEVAVPLGTFKTVRVVVSGQRSGTDLGAVAGIRWNPYFVARFRYTAWYAPEVARYVRSRHMQWNPGGELTGDEIVQLVEYRKN